MHGNLSKPLVEPFSGADPALGVPEVTEVHYDLWLLRITLRFDHHDTPVYVEFDGVKGFRVLDEVDLTNFWSPEVRVDGWLLHVKSGGWSTLESTRSDFISGIAEDYDEYLLLGINDCVSIFTYAPPRIYAPTI